MTLTRDDYLYLASLVRMDIRKDERGVAKFAPRPGQSDAEVAEALAKIVAALKRHRSTYEKLVADRKALWISVDDRLPMKSDADRHERVWAIAVDSHDRPYPTEADWRHVRRPVYTAWAVPPVKDWFYPEERSREA